MSFLILDHISQEFPGKNGPIKVLDRIHLKVEKGEFVSLIGHSGCGKSTILNLIAGFLEPTEGGDRKSVV